jgi:hypothetical protein
VKLTKKQGTAFLTLDIEQVWTSPITVLVCSYGLPVISKLELQAAWNCCFDGDNNAMHRCQQPASEEHWFKMFRSLYCAMS